MLLRFRILVTAGCGFAENLLGFAVICGRNSLICLIVCGAGRSNDFVTHLRHHAGFIKEGGFWEGPKLIWDCLWRLLPYYVWDLGLHLKTPPDIGNQLHLFFTPYQFAPYQQRIEATYLRGKREAPLVRLNQKDIDAPHLVINGNLVSSGRPRAFETESNRPYRDNYNFEVTRDFIGSDGLGYIQLAGFGLPVVEAQTEDRQPAWFNPRKVVVED